jgi:hypothetical protein
MALALLDLLALGESGARLRVDTGTNRYYQLKLGRASGTREGFDWIDDVIHETPVQLNSSGGGTLATSTTITLPFHGLSHPRPGLPAPPVYAQLFSFKTPDRRGLAFSQVVALDRTTMTLEPTYHDLTSSTALTVSDRVPVLNRPRVVACRTCAETQSLPKVEDVLGLIVRALVPVAQKLFPEPPAVGSGAAGSGTTTPGAALLPSGSAAAPPGATGGESGGALGSLLQAIGGALPGLLGTLGIGQLSGTKSMLIDRRASGDGNRFLTHVPLARPMVFGLDDAAFGMLAAQVIGPLIKALPELLNSSNQKHIELEKSRNHLISDLVGDVEKRVLLQQVLQAQQQAPRSQSPDVARLADLLQQAASAPASSPSGGASPGVPSVSTASSLSQSLSTRAIATFITAPPIDCAGGPHVLFARGRPITLQVKLAVTDPVPETPLPKAIVRVVIKDPADQRVLAEQVVKRHDLAAGATVPVPFTAEDLAGVPTGRPVSLLAEIRWRLSNGAERKALGSEDAVFTDRLFLKTRGGSIGPDKELTDMGRFRPFWNKVWESPTLGDDKSLWGLDATMKYTVMLTSTENSNGLMETRLSSSPDASSDGSRVQRTGRMKAGIECSVDELAKLAALWDGEPQLDADHVAAFRTSSFAKENAGEVITSVKLDGRKEDRGLVWVVPVLGLVDYTLGVVKAVDDNGQVTAADEEHAHFPVPTAIRVLALRSGDAGEADGEEPSYHFDGYRIEHSEKVVLTPHG